MSMKGNFGEIEYVINESIGGELPKYLTQEEVKKARNFHLSMDEYQATPLASLDHLAEAMGVKKIYIKDESYRFGLNAFKGLGGTYSIARMLCKKLGVDIKDASFSFFNQPEVQEKIKDMVFVTATDGNHGRGVAWAASKLGCKSVVYMPKGSSEIRLQAIKNAGAEASITDLNYDDAVRLANQQAKENGWFIVQDTAWEGYEDIPVWITQGYTTMADEALDQLQLEGVDRPTHVFLQAGVGSLAGGVLGYYANVFKDNVPVTIIAEPEEANCIYKSAHVGDGEPHNVTGDLNTIMAGLACGEPNPITWKVLRDFATAYVSCPDYIAATGMRMLANPMGKDRKVVAGESGAVGAGLLYTLMQSENDLREKLGLNEESIVLCFNTEGDTDPVHYRKVVCEGKNPQLS